ncbi:helix-turn-helix domain-containing protein [Verminephrobacter aporrectodeae]|uniref:helix-turn-helix domain-containing protein n=1 Tax=Verminephrobacter aporrectodeae TaxID=1110389 RepID=UPI001F2FC380|nr:helix-turn-helix transcriptional regulator [Verminephrobacter aporrectodeae]
MIPGVATAMGFAYHVRMNTFSNAFQSEIVRIARRELKPELQAMRKMLSGHRLEIAALKREIKALVSQSKAAQRAVAPSQAEEAAPPGKPRQVRFKAQAFAEKRAALGITQKDMAKLLGASVLSVYKWESGHVQPRAAQLERIVQVLRMGKRTVLETLGQP